MHLSKSIEQYTKKDESYCIYTLFLKKKKEKKWCDGHGHSRDKNAQCIWEMEGT